MAILLQDSFTAADGTNLVGHTPEIGDAWISDTLWSHLMLINSNKLTCGGGEGYGAQNTTNVGADCYVQVDLTAVPTVNAAHIGLRCAVGLKKCYELYFSATNIVINRRFNGTGYLLLSLGVAPEVATYKLQIVGDTLTAYKNGVSLGSVVNTVITLAGATGLNIETGSGCTMDNLEAGNILPAVPNLTLVQSGQNKNTLSWTL